MAKIYVASSWRNELQPGIVAQLREAGHEVYDFRNPPDAGRGEVMGGRGTGSGFQWSEIDPNWRKWTAKQYRQALENPIAKRGFDSDFGAMQWCDICLLVLPCGRSAHLELGWCAGDRKRTIVLTRDGEEPELMADMATAICINMDEVLKTIPTLMRFDLSGSFDHWCRVARSSIPTDDGKPLPLLTEFLHRVCGSDDDAFQRGLAILRAAFDAGRGQVADKIRE